MLHRNGEDSAVIKEKPRYVTKLDSSGNFHFRYLSAGTYHLYALEDRSRSRRYFDGKQLFGFANDPVQISSDVLPITLYAFVEEKITTAATSSLSFNRTGGDKTDNEKLKYASSVSAGRQELITDLTIQFQYPLKVFDSTLLHLSTDTTFIPEKNYVVGIDSLNKRITLKTTWKPGTRYNLIIDKEFAEDSLGNKLAKSDTLVFTARKLSDYGSVKINYPNADLSKNPILLFYIGNIETNSIPLTAKSFYQPLFSPGNYELRVLFDENKNGKWDTGEFFVKHKQPELVLLIKDKFTVKENFDNELDLVIPDR